MPPESGSRQRRLRWQALSLGVLLLAMWLVALWQPVTRPQWEQPGTWAQEFLHPTEVNRWNRSHPVVTPQPIASVAYAPDGKRALAVGDSGTVLQSADGGQSWAVVASNSKESLTSVAYAPDGKSALAVGTSGTVIKSGDGGQSWAVVTGNSKALLSSVAYAPGSKSALAVGTEGTVLKSVDGGQSWVVVASNSKEWLNSVAYAPDGKSALAAGDSGTVLKSGDGGQTWVVVPDHKRSPAPWFYAVVLLAGVYACLVALGSLREVQLQLSKKGLLDKAVTDRPIDSKSQDRMAFGPLVAALAHFLAHSGTAPRLALAINAAWGMGKSSFMNMLAESLHARGGRTVRFNVWHNQHEDLLLAPLLTAVVQQAIPRLLSPGGLRFRCKLFWTRFRLWGW